MKKYIGVITKIFKNPSKYDTKLGRWSITYDENIIKHKVFWANEDHCGPYSMKIVKLKK